MPSEVEMPPPAHHDPKKYRVVRAEDVDILKSVKSLSHMVWGLLGAILTATGLIFSAGRWYADIPTKETTITKVEFDKHTSDEGEVLKKLDGRIGELTKSITDLNTTVAVLTNQMSNDENTHAPR